MSDCCKPTNHFENVLCPSCNHKGKRIHLITLKSLLLPNALVKLDAGTTYYFCSTPSCNAVYFNEDGLIFQQHDLKVPVFQKDKNLDTPVCYCFDWTRRKLNEAFDTDNDNKVINSISAHMKENRCGCEVNNPQGSCCLGNVKAYVKSLRTENVE